MSKPPAFQFYAKDWRSSPTISRMTLAERGVAITLMALAWDSDEPGTLPDDIALLSKMAAIKPLIVRHFVAKWPLFVVHKGSKYHIPKLVDLYSNYMQISEKRSNAAQSRYPANAQQKHHPAFASATASAKSTTTPPTPPSGGFVDVRFWGGTARVHLGRKRRIPQLASLQGARVAEAAEIYRNKGFEVEIISDEKALA